MVELSSASSRKAEIKCSQQLRNWGSLSAPQMVHQFWWAAAATARSWAAMCSGGSGQLLGQSPRRIAWLKD